MFLGHFVLGRFVCASRGQSFVWDLGARGNRRKIVAPSNWLIQQLSHPAIGQHNNCRTQQLSQNCRNQQLSHQAIVTKLWHPATVTKFSHPALGQPNNCRTRNCRTQQLSQNCRKQQLSHPTIDAPSNCRTIVAKFVHCPALCHILQPLPPEK